MLPSFTARYEITSNFRARFNYGETLRRPNFGDINPNYSLTGDLTNVGYGSGSAGTANLKPTTSKNYDVALEWYFGRNSAITVTGFRRDIQGLVVPVSQLEFIPNNGIVAGATNNFVISRPANASNGVLKGLEVGLTYFPTYLPSLLDGLGFQGSLTLLDSRQNVPVFDISGKQIGEQQSSFFGVSDFSYNATLAYDKGPIGARLSYVYRNPWQARYEARLFANPLGVWRRAEASLDFQLTARLTDRLGLTFDAVNLTRMKQQEYYRFGNVGDKDRYNLGTVLIRGPSRSAHATASSDMMTGGPWSPPATFGKDFARETHRPDPRASPRLVLRLGRRRSVRLRPPSRPCRGRRRPHPVADALAQCHGHRRRSPCRGNISAVHDPAILKDGNTYYLFTTGNAGMSRGCSAYAPRPISRTGRCTAAAILPCPLGQRPPCRARRACGLDISKVNGQYRLYYSISTFGKNQSAIGLATATKIDPNAPAANWVDQGPVIQSQTSDNFNAIDPMAFVDASGNDWMVFGSYWSGIKLIRLDPATGLRLAGDAAPRSLAERPAPDAIEGPYIIRHGDFIICSRRSTPAAKGPRAPITRWSAAPPRRTAPMSTATARRC